VIKKVYLCARYQRKYEMRDVAERLKSEGFTIVSTWHDNDVTEGDEYLMTDDQLGFEAERDFAQIRVADALLFFNKECRVGSHREVGAAVMVGKPVFGQHGPTKHPFDHYGITWCEGLTDAINKMREWVIVHDASRAQ